MRQAPIVIAVYATLAITLGGQWIAAKLGVTAVPALELSTMRFAISAAVLVVACAITRTPVPLQRWRPITAAAVCGVLGFNTLAFVGLSLTPASDSALIIPTTIPLATALFATLIHERLTSRKLVLGYVTGMVLIGTALLLPLGAVQQGYRDVPTWSADTWLAAGFLGVFSTAVAFVLFFWAVHRYGASLAAMVTYLTPIATLVLAFLILGERPLPLQLVGGAVIVVGVRLAARRSRAALGQAPVTI